MDATTEIPTSPPPLRLLSLDGGGIRGISELVILEEVMHRIKRTEGLSSVPLPADYFDLICGTSTGGLIALLLGRLRLSVPEAIDKYRILAEQVFSKKNSPGRDGTFKASNLVKAIKTVVEEKLGPGHADEKMFSTNGGCKTFVCAVPEKHINKVPRIFRTWSADENPGYNCRIWEAGRATSAAPTFFERIFIGDPGLQEEFIDVGVGCNNPVRFLVTEALREFGPEREVDCILSIGTGKPKVAGFKSPGLFQRALPLDLIKTIASMASESETEALAMMQRFQNCPGLYHRLNVERGLEEVSLEEWKKLGEVKTHTLAYLEGRDISNEVNVIAGSLAGRASQTFPLGQLDGIVPAPNRAPSQFYIYPSNRANHFVPRTGPQKDIVKYFKQPATTAMPTVVVLHGMGGCGKSQLALEYCQQSENDNSYSAIFWVDATSPAIIEQGINDLARQLSKPGFDIVDVEGNIHFVLSKLSTWPSSWLLVFDNFDDPHSFKDKSIKQYFPRSNKGSILVTSRDATARSLGYYIDASTMANEEALDLLFKRSETPRNDANLPDARRIVKRLKFHALAIDQAGAYILARSLDFGLFLEHYNKRRRQVLEETPSLWDYSRKLKLGQESETQLSVFTTWELSFNLITGDKKARGDKEHILTLFAFFDANEMADSLLEPYYSENDSWMASCTSDNAWDEYKFQDILKELRNLSLVQGLRIQKSGAIFALHPLVQDWAKLRICPECRKAYTVEATLVLENFIKANKFHEMAFNKRQTTFSHVESVVQNRVEYLRPEDHAQNASVLNATVIFVGSLESLGQYKVAEELCRHELEEIKDLFGKESPHTLSTLNGLAFILNSQGKYDEAEPMSQQTVALREKVSGKKHPETLTTMNNLAVLLQNQGKYDEAELIYRQTLALREKVLGREHPDTVLIRRALDGCLESRCNQSSAPQEESDVTR